MKQLEYKDYFNKNNGNKILNNIKNGLFINFYDIEDKIKIDIYGYEINFYFEQELIGYISYDDNNGFLIELSQENSLLKGKGNINGFGTFMLKYVITNAKNQEIIVCYVDKKLHKFYKKVLNKFKVEGIIKNHYFKGKDIYILK